MKIKIITCSRAYNLGAVLQTYALQAYLFSLKQEVKVIDYNPFYFRKNVSYTAVGSFSDKNRIIRYLYMLYKVPRRFVDHRIFKGFLKKYIPLTPEYRTVEELEKAQLKADLFICGSDQIWCPTKPTGKDGAMYLSFVKNESKVAYAASFGEEMLADEQLEFLKKQIQHFIAISVRESSGVSIVEKAGFECTQVLDPVFLLSQNTWISFSNKSKKYKKFGDYLLVYPMSIADPTSLLRTAREIAGRKNLQMVIIGKSKRGCQKGDRLISNTTPQDFVSLIHHSSFIVTNSFHGTAFSLIFNKEFIVFEEKTKVNTRIDSLLKLLHLSERYVPSANFNISQSIDYITVNQIIKEQILTSEKYLTNAIQKASVKKEDKK